MICSMKRSPLSNAIELAGGLTALARVIGVKPPTVSQWLTLKRPIPVDKCVAIEIAVKRQVTRKDLRPNDWRRYWPELSDETVA